MSVEFDLIERAAAINCIATYACMHCEHANSIECKECPHKKDMNILNAIPSANVKFNNIKPNAFEGAWYDNYCKSLQEFIDDAEENLRLQTTYHCFQKGYIQGLKLAKELFDLIDSCLCAMIPVEKYNNGFANKFECTNCKALICVNGFMKVYPYNRCTECGTKVLTQGKAIEIEKGAEILKKKRETIKG